MCINLYQPLVAQEWGSSWAHAQVLDLVLEARQSLVSSVLHLERLTINSSYSYLHGYIYFEYISFLVDVIITFVCRFIERLACYSLSIGLSSRASCKHGAYTMLCLWVHPILCLGGSSRRWQPHLSFVVHSKLSRFLNYRIVVASVELSIVGTLPSKRHLEVHKSRVSLSYSRVYILWSCNKNIIGI